MLSSAPHVFFDFVDPASYLMSRVLAEIQSPSDPVWKGFEVRAPPAPLIDPGGEPWHGYQSRMLQVAEALDVPMNEPTFVPWTRKAHEMGVLAVEQHCYEAVRDALFQAHFVRGLDIGRIDVLVDLGSNLGMDPGELRAVLGVDGNTSVVLSDRALGEEWGVVDVPTLVAGGRRMEGLQPTSAIEAWLNEL